MMSLMLHVYNGLARPADESRLAWDIGTTRHSENIIASAAHSLRSNKHCVNPIMPRLHCSATDYYTAIR